MIWIWEWFRQSLGKRWFLWTLFVVNFLGTIYGFIWYGNQLAVTPAYLIPFVPDSPTGSGLFRLYSLPICWVATFLYWKLWLASPILSMVSGPSALSWLVG